MSYTKVKSEKVGNEMGVNYYIELFENDEAISLSDYNNKDNLDGGVYHRGQSRGKVWHKYDQYAFYSNIYGDDSNNIIEGVSREKIGLSDFPIRNDDFEDESLTTWNASDYADELLRGLGGNDSIYGYGGDDTLEGGTGNDNLWGGDGNDTLEGGTGDDFLNGGSGQDVLDGGEGYDTASFSGGLYGVISEGNTVFNDGFGNAETLVNIEHVIGSDLTDVLTTGGDVIALSGGAGNDTLTAAASDEVTTLYGGHGIDYLYGNGNTTAVFDTSSTFFNVVSTGDNDWQVVTSGSVDVLYDVNRFALVDGNVTTSFEVSSFSTNDNYVNSGLTINAIAGTDGVDTVISGNNIGPTDYIIGLRGEVGSYLDFDSAKLASWINEISLPNDDIEAKRFHTNLVLSALGGTEIPGTGFVSGIASDVANYGYDKAQIDAQIETANGLIENDDTTSWGEIIHEVRDKVIITDFQIGVDNILLPAKTIYDHSAGTYGDMKGVWLQLQEGNINSKLVFIKNNYHTDYLGDSNTFNLSQDKFEDLIKELHSAGTYTHSVFNGSLLEGNDVVEGTFAGDNMLWGGETDRLEGRFGDDWLRGDENDNVMYGGNAYEIKNSNDQISIDYFLNGDHDLVYDHDGHDLLEGFDGNDTLYGESGNDTLDGGAGEDLLNGGIGDDLLVGGRGADVMNGNEGHDVFQFSWGDLGEGDVIRNFESGDRIVIDTPPVLGMISSLISYQASLDSNTGVVSIERRFDGVAGSRTAAFTLEGDLSGFSANSVEFV